MTKPIFMRVDSKGLMGGHHSDAGGLEHDRERAMSTLGYIYIYMAGVPRVPLICNSSISSSVQRHAVVVLVSRLEIQGKAAMYTELRDRWSSWWHFV